MTKTNVPRPFFPPFVTPPRSRFVIGVLLVIIVVAAVSFYRSFLFSSSNDMEIHRALRHRSRNGVNSRLPLQQQRTRRRKHSGNSFDPIALHHDGLFIRLAHTGRRTTSQQQTCDLLVSSRKMDCFNRTKGHYFSHPSEIQTQLARAGIRSLLRSSNKRDREHAVTEWHHFVKQEEKNFVFPPKQQQKGQQEYTFVLPSQGNPQCSSVDDLAGAIILSADNKGVVSSINSKLLFSSSSSFFADFLQICLQRTAVVGRSSTTRCLAEAALFLQNTSTSFPSVGNQFTVWLASTAPIPAESLLVSAAAEDERPSPLLTSISSLLSSHIKGRSALISLCASLVEASPHDQKNNKKEVVLQFPTSTLDGENHNSGAVWAHLLASNWISQKQQQQQHSARSAAETDAPPARKGRHCVARFLLPRSSSFVENKHDLFNTTSARMEEYMKHVLEGLESTLSVFAGSWKVEASSNNNPLEQQFLARLDKNRRAAAAAVAAAAADKKLDDPFGWAAHFSADPAASDVLITVASDLSTAAVCGFFSADASPAADSTSSCPRGAFLFVPFGTSQKDIAAFETTLDACASFRPVSAAEAAARRPFLLFHRSILETDRSFSSRTFHKVSSGSSNRPLPLVLDQREAEEAWIELASSVRAAADASSVKAIGQAPPHTVLHLGPWTVRRYHQRDFVDPDFFEISGGSSSNSGSFVALARATQSIIFVINRSSSIDTTLSHVFCESIFSLFRRPAVPQAATPDFLFRNVYEKELAAARANPRASPFSDSLLAAFSNSISAGPSETKRQKKLRRLGNKSKIRFFYRREDSEGLNDLRVIFSSADKSLPQLESFSSTVARLGREARDDLEQRQLYSSRQARRSLGWKEDALLEVRSLMIKQHQKQQQKRQKRKEEPVVEGDSSSIHQQCCERSTAGAASVTFVVFPWVLDNIYHVHNDNILPIFLAAQRVLGGEKERRSAATVGYPPFLCPVAVEELADENGRSLCSRLPRHLLLLPTSRTNTRLPAWDFISKHLFDSIVDFSPNYNNEASSSSSSSSCADIVACINSFSTLVWGRPARPFSANAKDVEQYFDAETLVHYRTFLNLLPEVREARRRVEEKVFRWREKLQHGQESADDAVVTEIRVVIMERRSKRVFESDAFFAAVLVSKFEELSQKMGRQQQQHLRVNFSPCCEGLTFAQQVALVSSADVLVGVHGAGLLHILWLGNDQRQNSTFASWKPPPPLAVHISSRLLPYHEQTVLERLASLASHATKRQGIVVPVDDSGTKFTLLQQQRDDRAAGLAVRWMTTFTNTGARDPAQHWSDDFDLPREEIETIADRIVQRYFSHI